MNLLSRVIIIPVVAWVLGCAMFGQEINPTLMGIVIIALLRPLVEKLYERVRKEQGAKDLSKQLLLYKLLSKWMQTHPPHTKTTY